MIFFIQEQDDDKQVLVCVFDRDDLNIIEAGHGARLDGAQIGLPGKEFVFGFEETAQKALDVFKRHVPHGRVEVRHGGKAGNATKH